MQLITIAMTYNTTSTTLTEVFHVTENKREVVKELCRIVAYYHLVEAVDNGSPIHSKLRVNANDSLTYWVSLLLLSTSRLAIYLHSFAHKINTLMSIDRVMSFYMQRTTYCSACNVDLREFGRMCERAALHPLMNIPATLWR